jgi:hypothetical protein
MYALNTMYEQNNYSSLVLLLVNFHVALRLISSHTNISDITHVEAYGYVLAVYTFLKILYDTYRQDHFFIGNGQNDKFITITTWIVLMIVYTTEYLIIRIGTYNDSLVSQATTIGFYIGFVMYDILLMNVFPVEVTTNIIHNILIICRVLLTTSAI